MMDAYDYVIAELSLAGECGLGPCHPSTVRRWGRAVNARLARENANWRVRADARTQTLRVAGTSDERGT